jgi:tetratricopeptide (TPR) repeat protein
LGLASLVSKDHAIAQKWLETAVDHARSINMRRRLSDALIGLGMVEINTGQLSKAGDHLREAVDIARASESSESLARGLAAMARFERMTGDQDSALTFANEAVGIAQKISTPTYEMWGELEIGAAILAQGRSTEALVHSLRALTLAAQAHEGWIARAEAKNVHDRVLESLAMDENRSR